MNCIGCIYLQNNSCAYYGKGISTEKSWGGFCMENDYVFRKTQEQNIEEHKRIEKEKCKVYITINGKQLTIDEAKALYDELSMIFSQEKYRVNNLTNELMKAERAIYEGGSPL